MLFSKSKKMPVGVIGAFKTQAFCSSYSDRIIWFLDKHFLLSDFTNEVI